MSTNNGVFLGILARRLAERVITNGEFPEAIG